MNTTTPSPNTQASNPQAPNQQTSNPKAPTPELAGPQPGSTTPAGRRALVLGGGGAAGNAWSIGVVAGLLDAGVDVTRADLIIATSAGSTAAAQISAADPDRLLADIVSPAPPPARAGRPGSGGARGGGPVVDHLRRTDEIFAAATDLPDLRRKLGASALALDAASDGAWTARWREIVAARLPSPHWPERPLQIVAVDARTGEPVVFDRDSGVDLVDAVAASCSSGLPYAIGDRRYIDGGYRRSSENADLAAGYGRVLVLSPLGGRTRAPLDWGLRLAVQVEELRAGGSSVETVLPDDDALDAFGPDLTDPSIRPPAARAGHRQGAARARELAEFWL
ncbi:patatin-like phospholipase family protein [Microlunatus ginsengisoli]|uniref:Patatin-like phospholipase family protein n=1 Tax=Microlunatus ginsengisoli TaxID=363863 RepID=A0ABP7A133_9ACTN